MATQTVPLLQKTEAKSAALVATEPEADAGPEATASLAEEIEARILDAPVLLEVQLPIRNLRAKIEKNTRRKYIRTIHGVGYMISI